MLRHAILGSIGFGFLLVTLPLISLAQENQPQPGAYCPRITQDLKFRDTDATTGGQVSELQHFLADYYEDYPDWAITGNFRGTTLSFVKRFQREQNLPAFGYVGPLTRAAIARVCGSTETERLPPTSPPTPVCIWNGRTVQNNHSVTAYLKQFVGDEEACQSETRTCTNGVLSGTYQYATCSHQNPGTTSCTWNGQTIAHGVSVTAYQSSSVLAGQQCQSQTRTCTNGALSGTYQYATCSVATATCTPEAPQTQTLSCPAGQTGSITQTRTSTCPGPTWGAWTTTSNTCTTPPPPPPINVGSCTYKGQTYREGEQAMVTVANSPGKFQCDNGYWIAVVPGTNLDKQNVCFWFAQNEQVYTDLGCTPDTIQSYGPYHGTAPFSKALPLVGWFYYDAGRGANSCSSLTVDWGDGSALETYQPPLPNCAVALSHTWSAPGSYTVKNSLSAVQTHPATTLKLNIRVDGPTASIQNQSQLASALAALESALKAIL